METSSLPQFDPQHIIALMFQSYPDVVNVTQMCDMLGGISTKTAYKLLQANRIQHFKIGRAYKIPKVQIIAYLQSIINPQQVSRFDALMH
ncbi:helix-turn-helix domain-containing protein [Paenibacillus durus]|nr:helix-turn-helix domain-containing protein [Paenibacillus durus]